MRRVTRLLSSLLMSALALGVGPAAAHATFITRVNIGSPAGAITSPTIGAASDGSAVLAYSAGGDVMVAQKRPGFSFDEPIRVGQGPRVSLVVLPTTGQTAIAWADSSGAVHVVTGTTGALAPLPGTFGTAPNHEVATAIAPGGRVFIGYATSTGATMESFAPDATVATPGATINGGAAASSLAIATQTGAPDAAYLGATIKSGQTASVWEAGWASGAGAGTPHNLFSASDTASGPVGAQVTDSYFNDWITAVPGVHPSFFWVLSDDHYDPAVGQQSFSGELFREDEPYATPTTVDPGVGARGITAPAFAADPAGGATAVWAPMSPGASIAASSRPSDTAAFGLRSALSDLTSTFDAATVSAVAAASTGAGSSEIAYVADQDVYAARVTAAGALAQSEPSLLSGPAGGDIAIAPTAAGTDTGDTAVAWVSATGDQAQLQLAFDDATPPRLALDATTSADEAVAPVDGSNAAAIEASETFRLRATADDLWTPTTVTWDFGDGTTATRPSTNAEVIHRFPGPGTYVITVTATDAAGNTTSQTITRTVPPTLTAGLPSTITQPTFTPIATPHTTPVITLSALSLSAKRFAVASGKGRPHAGQGTSIAVTLSAAASLELTVARTSAGYLVGTKCKAKKPKATAKPKRCTIRKAVGTLRAAGASGKNAIAFSGVVAGKRLPAGTYELTVSPIAPGASHGSGGSTVAFTIKR